jgi:glutamate formiminotransferase
MQALLECVVNISEGRNHCLLDSFSKSIRKELGQVLHRDIGAGANRTVYTFAVEPENLLRCGLALYEIVLKNVDLRNHRGEHPRLGSIDVFPIIPLQGISKAATLELTRELADKVGSTFNLPVFLYAHSATTHIRKNLANVRRGEFEGLTTKLQDPEWHPDFGPNKPHPSAGATVIGCRDFLIAFNLTIDTPDVSIAKRLAQHVRKLPGVRAIGWFIPEYGKCQISCNIFDFKLTNPVELYRYAEHLCDAEKIILRGSELIGLIPEETVRYCLHSLGTTPNYSVTPDEFQQVANFLKLELHHGHDFALEQRTLERLIVTDRSPAQPQHQRPIR